MAKKKLSSRDPTDERKDLAEPACDTERLLSYNVWYFAKAGIVLLLPQKYSAQATSAMSATGVVLAQHQYTIAFVLTLDPILNRRL